jgi:hypothetical protein
LREEERGRHIIKELDSTNMWPSWYRLRTVVWRSQLDSPTHFYYYDRSSWASRNSFTYKELANRFTIILFSSAAFGTGLGDLFSGFLKGWP